MPDDRKHIEIGFVRTWDKTKEVLTFAEARDEDGNRIPESWIGTRGGLTWLRIPVEVVDES